MILKEIKSPRILPLTIPCANQRSLRKVEAKINLSKTILQTPRLSLIPITKIASINESFSDSLNDYVKSKELSSWKSEFENTGYGLWCIHAESNEYNYFPPDIISATSSRLSLYCADDFNFRLPPSSTSSSSSPSLTCSSYFTLPIGYIHLSKDSFINLGIFQSHTSQGYATEALKKLLFTIFDLGLTNGVVKLRVENDAIARVAEKLGFMKGEKNIFSISKIQFRDLWNSDDHE
jgi:RimJ/RimL family protein N-acetyltransferase